MGRDWRIGGGSLSKSWNQFGGNLQKEWLFWAESWFCSAIGPQAA
jgi:hypothetical protein